MSNKNNNPTGKGGFGDNPENINTNGRPPKGYSITEWFREMLNSKPEVKETLGRAILKQALDGDSSAQKMIWSYMDGQPVSQHNVATVDLTKQVDKLLDDMDTDYGELANQARRAIVEQVVANNPPLQNKE